MSKKKKTITLAMEIGFNDMVMQEMGLDINDHDHIYDEEDEVIIQYDGCYLKYYDTDYIDLRPDEIKFNLIRNARLMDTLVARYIDKFCIRHGVQLSTYHQVGGFRGAKGYAAITYVENGVSKEIRSDELVNESVRLFNLVCKINGTDDWYDFEKFDIVEEKK